MELGRLYPTLSARDVLEGLSTGEVAWLVREGQAAMQEAAEKARER